MKKKGELYKKLLFWIVIVIVVGLIIFFFPKSCGGSGGIGGPVTTIDCNCFGFTGHDSSMTDASINNCFGICIKSSCKTTVSPPSNLPIINDTNNTIIPPTTTEVNISFNNSLKLFIKASNPQYKKGQDITIQYTLENTKNETLVIPLDVSNGIKIKNPGGKILDYIGSDGGVKVIIESLTLGPGKKVTGNFIIKGDDYDFFTIGNSADGYFNTISAYVGDVESNRIIPRFLKY